MSEEKDRSVQLSEREQFSKFLEKTAEEVRGWPAWKQAILGAPQSTMKGPNVEEGGRASRERQ